MAARKPRKKPADCLYKLDYVLTRDVYGMTAEDLQEAMRIGVLIINAKIAELCAANRRQLFSVFKPEELEHQMHIYTSYGPALLMDMPIKAGTTARTIFIKIV